MPRRRWTFPALLVLILALPLLADDPPRYAGPTDTGFLLPNGWTITPAGKQLVLPDMALNILPLADGKHALVACSGYNQHQVALAELAGPAVVDTARVSQSWVGL